VKISEFIIELSRIQARQGDMPVYIRGLDGRPAHELQPNNCEVNAAKTVPGTPGVMNSNRLFLP
jgi:hypothetical protein